jgi:hypothetical protein
MVFLPRVVTDDPWAEENPGARLLIDANFSTIWAEQSQWSASALKALFNSAWARALMEASGTPLGGGALKLEAAHLRHLPVPEFSDADRAELARLGAKLSPDDLATLAKVDAVILRALGIAELSESLSSIAGKLTDVGQRLRGQRQRTEA